MGMTVSREPEAAMAARSDRPDSHKELTDLLLSTGSFEDYAQQVVTLAAAAVLPGSSCGLTLQRGGNSPTTVGSSDSLASRVDEIQYGTGQGPCLQAMTTGKVVLVADLGVEDRWGDYRLHAVAAGVRASLSMPVRSTADDTAGALNFYSTAPDAFQSEHVAAATHFADQATGALALAVRLADQAALSEQMKEALTSRSVIDQAIGIIMAQNRCSAETAFDLLRQASQHRNVKLRNVAEDIVTAVGTTRPPR